MPRVKKVRPQPRVMTNKLIAYYRVDGKYDTPLDALEVQRRRVSAWAEKNEYEIVEEVNSYGDTYDMMGIFSDAYRMCGHVIVASGCRVAGEAVDFYSLYESEETPLLTTDSQVGGNARSNKKVLGYAELLLFSAHEYYKGQCAEWLG